MNYDSIRERIESANGRFCYVEFIKTNGELRKMIVQPAKLKFHIKGDDASDKAQRAAETRRINNPNLLNVWDVEKEAIRCINMDTVRTVHVNGEVYNYAS